MKSPEKTTPVMPTPLMQPGRARKQQVIQEMRAKDKPKEAGATTTAELPMVLMQPGRARKEEVYKASLAREKQEETSGLQGNAPPSPNSEDK